MKICVTGGVFVKRHRKFLPVLAIFVLLLLLAFAAYGRLFGPISALDSWGNAVPDALTIRYINSSGKNEYLDVTEPEILAPLVALIKGANGVYFMGSDAVPVGFQLTFRSGEGETVYPGIELPGDGFVYIGGQVYRISNRAQQQILDAVSSAIQMSA